MLLDGFDPKVHLQQAIDALPVYKSNEPGQLDRAGIKYKLFDPSDDGVPGTFGILYTSEQFLDDHPTAAQDFVRASLQGMADSLADPAAAVAASLALIKAGGNKNFLSDEGETFRWQVESQAGEGRQGHTADRRDRSRPSSRPRSTPTPPPASSPPSRPPMAPTTWPSPPAPTPPTAR